MTCRLGVIGGGVAVQMARSALVSFESVAVTYLTGQGTVFPEYEFVNSVEEMISSAGVDAVYIATPADTHAPLLARAIEAGLPVLVEKPLAANVGQVELLSDLDTTRVAVAFRKRFSDLAVAFRKVRQRESGERGTANIRWLAPHPGEHHWKATNRHMGGGVCLDIGSHVLDFVEHCIGPIARIDVKHVETDGETNTDVHIRFRLFLEVDIEVEVEIGWATDEPIQIVSYVQGPATIVWTKDARSPSSSLATTWGRAAQTRGSYRNDEYLRMFSEFDDFRQGNAARVLAKYADGVRNLQLLSEIIPDVAL